MAGRIKRAVEAGSIEIQQAANVVERVGLKLLSRCEPWKVSPGKQYESPLLKEPAP